VPDATSKGLVGWWKFDEAHTLDSSRLQNHGVSVVPAGPGRNGQGASARFDGDLWFEVPSSTSLATTFNHVSVSFWAYFVHDLEDKHNFDCPIVYMGKEFDSLFELKYNPETRHLSATRIRNWVTLRSLARPRTSTWHHIAITISKKHFRLYVNGILDTQAQIPPQLDASKVIPRPLFQFYAGGVPWEGSKKRGGSGRCSVPLLLDDLRLYNRVLRKHEIQAESFPSLGSVEPSFIKFACERCYFEDARKACPKSYHLCHKPELLAGALAGARKMGWVGLNVPVWENDVTDSNPEHKGSPSEMKAGICCEY